LTRKIEERKEGVKKGEREISGELSAAKVGARVDAQRSREKIHSTL
jgi:hypothetical protein